MYPPRLLALCGKDSGVIRAIVYCCGAIVLEFPYRENGVLMVGIPMDGVGAGYVGMWLLLYRYSPVSGGVFPTVSEFGQLGNSIVIA